MKTIYFAMLVVLVIVSAVFPQRRFGRDDDMRERMAELEKIKLIEVMEMDEETTLRFFSRRAEFQKQHEKMRQELHLILARKTLQKCWPTKWKKSSEVCLILIIVSISNTMRLETPHIKILE